jgi:hypothetical protein
MSKPGSSTASRLVSLGSFFALAPSALFACGGTASNTPAAAPAPAVSAAPVSKEEPPDLAPVAAPAELVAIARFKKPETAVETVSAWANFPVKVHDVLPSEMRGLEQVVAWDAPLEFAMALDPLGEGKVPEPLSVLSIGLTSLDGALDFARSQGQSVRRLRSGVYRIGDSEDVACAVGLAVGSAPARLVCGHRAHDIDGLFNYATRGLPTEPMQNLDFQLELRLDPVKKKYGAELGSARLFGGFLLREVQMDNPRFDRALSDAAYGLIDETLAFVHDLDKVRLDANVDSAKNLINVRQDTQFSGQQSWLVQAAAETVPLSAPPPAEFWQLPADAASASYSVGWKPGRLKPLGRALGELLDAYLDAEKVPAGLRAQSSKALEGLFDLSSNAVRADGALTDVPSDPLLAADYRFFGWQVNELPGDAKPVLAVFDGLTAALGSRDLAQILKKRAQISEAMWPKFSTHAVNVKGFKPGAKAYRVDVPRGMIEQAVKGQSPMVQDFAAALAAPLPKGKLLVKSVPMSFIVASDGAHTFIAASADEKLLIKRLESLKDPKAPVLQSREGLDRLKGSAHVGGGFWSLNRFAGMLGLRAREADAAKVMTALPHHGETPILFFSDTTAEGPDSTITFSVPRAAVEDLGALAPVLALMAGKNSSVLATP